MFGRTVDCNCYILGVAMEHFRSENYAGDIYQWCDAELVMILDSVTGKPERFGDSMNSIGTLGEAKKFASERKGWEERMVIVRLCCISAHKI